MLRCWFNIPGQVGSVPKGTKVVLEVTDKQRLDRHKAEWDVIVHRQSGANTVLQVIPKFWTILP